MLPVKLHDDQVLSHDVVALHQRDMNLQRCFLVVICSRRPSM